MFLEVACTSFTIVSSEVLTAAILELLQAVLDILGFEKDFSGRSMEMWGRDDRGGGEQSLSPQMQLSTFLPLRPSSLSR